MASGDGHVLRSGPGLGPLESYPSSRWEELTSMAVTHAQWNMKLGVPCEFILLNSPNPRNPVDGQDVFRITQINRSCFKEIVKCFSPLLRMGCRQDLVRA